MPLQPVELLRFAKSLTCSDEATCRAAVSRAYYCAYHCALPFAQQLPATPTYNLTGPLRHQEVADRLIAWQAPAQWGVAASKAGDIKEIARFYRAALAKRKVADYHLGSTVDEKEARMQISRCSDINQFFVRLSTALSSAAA